MITIICSVIAAMSAIAVALITRSQNKKINETHTQVTKNGGTSSNPTVLDKLATIAEKIDRVDNKLDDHILWHLHKERL